MPASCQALGFFFLPRAGRASWRLSQPQTPVPPHLVHPGEEGQPLIFYQETTAQILVRALNPLDYRKWRYKPAYWKVLKVFKVGVGTPELGSQHHDSGHSTFSGSMKGRGIC